MPKHKSAPTAKTASKANAAPHDGITANRAL